MTAQPWWKPTQPARPEYEAQRRKLEDEILFREFKSGIGLYLNTEFFYTGGNIL